MKNTESIVVIHEKDLEDNEQIVIGVADSVESAERIIDEYYGEYEQIIYRDIRDSNIEYSKVLEVKSAFGSSRVEIWLEWFSLNSL
jgi:hypothetical protein